jgi:hypothetical protein
MPGEWPELAKRPVAWRVKAFADGWILFDDEAAANRHAEDTGALMQGLYVREWREQSGADRPESGRDINGVSIE